MRAPPHTRWSSKSSFEGSSETESPAPLAPLLSVSEVAARLNCSAKTFVGLSHAATLRPAVWAGCCGSVRPR